MRFLYSVLLGFVGCGFRVVWFSNIWHFCVLLVSGLRCLLCSDSCVLVCIIVTGLWVLFECCGNLLVVLFLVCFALWVWCMLWLFAFWLFVLVVVCFWVVLFLFVCNSVAFIFPPHPPLFLLNCLFVWF